MVQNTSLFCSFIYIIYMRQPKKIPFWERAKKLMLAKKINQKDLAGSIGLKYCTLRFWLCYGYYPDVKTACDIAKALGVSVEYLVKGRRGKIGSDDVIYRNRYGKDED